MRSENRNITRDQCKDSGLALVLVCLIGFQFWQLQILMLPAIVFLVIAMTYPPIFKPFAKLWFALSTALGSVMSKIILSLLYFLLVLPVGLLRRALGKDTMRLKGWKKGNESVLKVRNHLFVAKDIEHPY